VFSGPQKAHLYNNASKIGAAALAIARLHFAYGEAKSCN